MATVRMLIRQGDEPSKEQLERLRDGAEREIVFDEDSPEMTREMLAKFRRVYPKQARANT